MAPQHEAAAVIGIGLGRVVCHILLLHRQRLRRLRGLQQGQQSSGKAPTASALHHAGDAIDHLWRVAQGSDPLDHGGQGLQQRRMGRVLRGQHAGP